jgi:type VII secretion protein EccB
MLQTRKDLLQAHRLMTRRAGLALLQAEPDPPDQPLRRLNVAMFASVLIAVAVAAVSGIWGLVSPGHAGGLTAPGSLLIDEATGTPFVPCQHQKLCPVVNYASARLALNTTAPAQRSVSQASLDRYAQGPEIGIPGLPPLPQPGMLAGEPWSVCTRTVTNAIQQRHTVTTLVAGERVGGRAVSGHQALLVQAAGISPPAYWLIWHGERMRVPAPQYRTVTTALRFLGSPALVPPEWLNAFAQNANDFAPPVTRLGGLVTGPDGPAASGRLFHEAGTRQYFLLTRRGLVPVTQTEERLLRAIPGQKMTTISPAGVSGHEATTRVLSGGLPPAPPAMVNGTLNPAAPKCVVYPGPATAALVTVGGRVPAGQAVHGQGFVNQIAMRPGAGALVAEVNGANPDVTGYFLVTRGVRYGFASPRVAAVLGYQLSRQQVLMPASVVDLIPQGPAFDPAAARRTLAG